MKHTSIALLMAFLLFPNCFNHTDSNEISGTEQDFTAAVAFIDSCGNVPKGHVPWDHSYDFFDWDYYYDSVRLTTDSAKSRYSFTTIRQDKDGYPSAAGSVSYISVWIVKGLVQDTYVSGKITREGVSIVSITGREGRSMEEEVADFQAGYRKFVAFAKIMDGVERGTGENRGGE